MHRLPLRPWAVALDQTSHPCQLEVLDLAGLVEAGFGSSREGRLACLV
jgi:hypothetical protein